MRKTIITIALVAVLAGTVGYKAGTHTKENEVNQSYQSGYDKGVQAVMSLEEEELEDALKGRLYSKGYNQGFYDGYHYDVRTEDYGEFEDYAERYPKK